MATSYDINYGDERFQKVESDKQQALTEMEKTYSGMINEADSYYQAQIDASKQWADTQSKLQQENTDFAIEKIEQNKEQAQKDYTKEQSGAYVDWQKQSNQYGVNAENIAAGGLTNTGFSESSQVSMYNTYQNRVATARESYMRAVQNYDNSMTEARLQNSSALAEIAYQALQQQLELSLQGFQYKNNLILEQANKKMEVNQLYYNRYQDVLAQMNQENALAEQIRQYEQNYALSEKEYEEGVRQFNEQLALQQAEFEESKRQFEEQMALRRAASSGGGGGGGGSRTTSLTPVTGDEDDAAAVDAAFNASVLPLGRGNITASELDRLINNGEVIETLNPAGLIVYQNVTSPTKPPTKTSSTVKKKVTSGGSTKTVARY